MGTTITYGTPYMGSKSRIAPWIIGHLPPAKHLYDLFMGGGAVTHAAALSGKWRHVHANDLNPLLPQLFHNAVTGLYSGRFEWCSHSRLFEVRDTDPYLAAVYSFGGNMSTYLYSPEIEPYKKAFHEAVALCDCRQISDLGLPLDLSGTLRERLEQAQHAAAASSAPILRRLSSCETLHRMLRIQRLDGLLETCGCSLSLTSADYSDIRIKPDSVVYCDIPYLGTSGYRGMPFDFQRFCDWCSTATFPVVVSSYSLPPDRFTPIASVYAPGKFHPHHTVPRNEQLYVPRHQAHLFPQPMFAGGE